MSEPILKVEGVQAKYGDFVAVEEATLDVPQGIIVSVIGANGAGKSTLMDTIAGVHKPTAGTITFKGEDITGMPAEKVVLRGLSLVPQGSRCFIRMTVEDNLVMGSYPKAARAKVCLLYTSWTRGAMPSVWKITAPPWRHLPPPHATSFWA